MKKLVVISVCMVLAAFPLLAQLPSETVPEKSDKNPVKTLYQKYENNPKVSSIYVSSEMLDLVSMLGDIHGEEFVGRVIVDGHEPFDVKDDNMVRASKLLKNLKGLYLLSTEDAVTAAAMQKDLSVDGKYVEIIDRKEAIRYVIAHGQPGDVIVLAGKGHEDYQEIKGVKYPMDERVLIQEVLEELGKK